MNLQQYVNMVVYMLFVFCLQCFKTQRPYPGSISTDNSQQLYLLPGYGLCVWLCRRSSYIASIIATFMGYNPDNIV